MLSFEELPQVSQDQQNVEPVKPIFHKTNEIFFDNTITVQKGQGFIQPGQWTFYFQYLLPEGLPGTFNLSGGGEKPGDLYDASIGYVIEAKMLHHTQVAAQLDAMQGVSLLAGSVLNVNSKASPELKYIRVETKKNFTLSKGGLITGILINQGGYSPGQQDILVLDVNNTSVNAITGFDIEVYEVFTFKKAIKGSINGYTQDVVKERKVHTVTLKDSLPPMFYGRKYIDFFLPQTLAPSSQGYSASRLCYKLNVKSFVSIGFHEVSIELPIYAPQSIPQNPPLQIPSTKMESWRQRYQPDEEASNCPQCTKAFGVMRRRHHCRQCLQVFCSKCCSKSKKVPELGFTDSAPVCDGCYSKNPQPAPVTVPVSLPAVFTPVIAPWEPVKQPTFDPLQPYMTTVSAPTYTTPQQVPISLPPQQIPVVDAVQVAVPQPQPAIPPPTPKPTPPPVVKKSNATPVIKSTPPPTKRERPRFELCCKPFIQTISDDDKYDKVVLEIATTLALGFRNNQIHNDSHKDIKEHILSNKYNADEMTYMITIAKKYKETPGKFNMHDFNEIMEYITRREYKLDTIKFLVHMKGINGPNLSDYERLAKTDKYTTDLLQFMIDLWLESLKPNNHLYNPLQTEDHNEIENCAKSNLYQVDILQFMVKVCLKYRNYTNPEERQRLMDAAKSNKHTASELNAMM
eukprot:Awhi_evm1s10550